MKCVYIYRYVYIYMWLIYPCPCSSFQCATFLHPALSQIPLLYPQFVLCGGIYSTGCAGIRTDFLRCHISLFNLVGQYYHCHDMDLGPASDQRISMTIHSLGRRFHRGSRIILNTFRRSTLRTMLRLCMDGLSMKLVLSTKMCTEMKSCQRLMGQTLFRPRHQTVRC